MAGRSAQIMDEEQHVTSADGYSSGLSIYGVEQPSDSTQFGSTSRPEYYPRVEATHKGWAAVSPFLPSQIFDPHHCQVMVAISTEAFLTELASVVAQAHANPSIFPGYIPPDNNTQNDSHDEGESPLTSYYIEPIVITGTITAKKALALPVERAGNIRESRWSRLKSLLLGRRNPNLRLIQDYLNGIDEPESSSASQTREEKTEAGDEVTRNGEDVFHDCSELPDHAPNEQTTIEAPDIDDTNTDPKPATGIAPDTDEADSDLELATNPFSGTEDMDTPRREKAWDAWCKILSDERYKKPGETLEQKKLERQHSDIDHS